MKNSQKGFVNIVLVVVIVILVGVVGYFAFVKKSEPVVQQPTPIPTTTQSKTPAPTPTPGDETANWKTYTNAEYGFEFKYPSNLELNVVNVTSGSNFDKRYVSITIDTPAKIAQMKQPNPGSGGTYLLFRFGASEPKQKISNLGCGTDPVLKTINMSGVPATMCDEQGMGSPGSMYLNFTRDNTILFSARSGLYSGSNKQIVDKILATFKNEPSLTQEQAQTLVLQTWGGCTPDSCSEVVVSVAKGEKNTYVVTATYEGLRDDSTAANRKVAVASYMNGQWILGQPTVTYACYRGHVDGSQGFTSALCI